jgi:hypothetical protein
MSTVRVCLGCGRPLNPDDGFNALSHYGHGYICGGVDYPGADCGLRESYTGDFISRKLQLGKAPKLEQ